jgi:hypothetical protein
LAQDEFLMHFENIWPFTVQIVVVRPLPCVTTKNTWQRFCFAHTDLRRAPQAHDKKWFPRCVIEPCDDAGEAVNTTMACGGLGSAVGLEYFW